MRKNLQNLTKFGQGHILVIYFENNANEAAVIKI
jgi:hypothetical protein